MSRRRPPPCSLPLVWQLEGPARRTVRRGEHPRGGVQRIELLDDETLDEFRRRFPEASAAAMDESLALDGELERQLEARQDLAAGLDLLHALPLLAVHVCLACGARVIARAERD